MYSYGQYQIVMSGQNQLMHYGISGQKWGIRRFQNEDRSFTEAGKRRYYPEKNPLLIRKVTPPTEKEKAALSKRIKEAQKVYEKAEQETMIASYRNRKRDPTLTYEKALLKSEQAKHEYRDLKILEKLQNKKHISQHQLNIAQKYKDEGMSDEKAQIQAYKRVRTEKLIAVAATTTVAMAAMQIAKVRRSDLDSIIPKDMKLQNLSTDPEKGVHDAFYAVYNEDDKQKYLGLFGGRHLQQGGPKNVAKMTMEVTENMKIAGANAARDTVSELIRNDSEYASTMREVIQHPWALQHPGYKNIKSVLSGNGQLSKEGYNLVNEMLVRHDKRAQTVTNKLFEAMRQKGYDGTIDLNDIWNSGYNAKAPVIIFNKGAKIGNISKEIINPGALQAGRLFQEQRLLLRQMLNTYVPIGTLAKVGAVVIDSKPISIAKAKKKIINTYKKEHPNTKLTDAQIIQNQIGG